MPTVVSVGDLLAGKYRVEKVLGAGGMGMVVAAMHIALEQRVALKFMLPDAMRSPQAVDRFLREAKSAVRLRSEHVCRVLDVGTLDDGAPYIVMEFMEGQDFADVITQRGPLPVLDVVKYLLQAIEGVAEAHANKIVHRDLKPANLFVTTDNDGTPLVKVLDFGISKSEIGGAATKTGDIMGSPAYMSPEQMTSSKDVDARADVWALGVILYQAVTGELPFAGDTLPALCMSVMTKEPRPPIDLRSALPPAFSDIVMCCLDKQIDRRFTNVGALAAALAPFGPPDAAATAARIANVLRRRAPVITPVHGLAATLMDTTGGSPRAPTPAPTVMETGSGSGGPMPATHVSTTLGGASGQRASAAGADDFPDHGGQRRRWWIGGAVASAVLAIGGGAFALRGTTGEPTATPLVARGQPLAGSGMAPADAAVARSVPDAAPEPPKPPTKVTLVIESEPSGADVIREVDGIRVGRTRFEHSLAPVPGGTLGYVVKLKGYDDERVELAADHDDHKHVVLKPAARTNVTVRKPPREPQPPQQPTRVPTGPTSDGMLAPK